MTSPQSREPRPIRTVELRVEVAADSRVSSLLKERFPSGKLEHGIFTLAINGTEPGPVAAQAMELLRFLKVATNPSKDFK
jgi:hypothetical protein